MGTFDQDAVTRPRDAMKYAEASGWNNEATVIRRMIEHGEGQTCARVWAALGKASFPWRFTGGPAIAAMLGLAFRVATHMNPPQRHTAQERRVMRTNARRAARKMIEITGAMEWSRDGFMGTRMRPGKPLMNMVNATLEDIYKHGHSASDEFKGDVVRALAEVFGRPDRLLSAIVEEVDMWAAEPPPDERLRDNDMTAQAKRMALAVGDYFSQYRIGKQPNEMACRVVLAVTGVKLSPSQVRGIRAKRGAKAQESRALRVAV